MKDLIGECLWPREEEQNTQISGCPFAQGPAQAFLLQSGAGSSQDLGSQEVTLSCSPSILPAELGLLLCGSHHGSGFGILLVGMVRWGI